MHSVLYSSFNTLLPIKGLDFQVFSLGGTFHKADTGEVMEGLQTSLDDCHLTRSWNILETFHIKCAIFYNENVVYCFYILNYEPLRNL